MLSFLGASSVQGTPNALLQAPRVVEISLSGSDFEKLMASGGDEKFRLSELRIGKNAILHAQIMTRGNTSIKFDKRSYKIEFKEPVRVFDNYPVKSVVLGALVEDPYYLNNSLAYFLLEKLDLFHSQYGFAKVTINGVKQGVYLMSERPEDGLRRRYPDSAAIARRDFGNQYEVKMVTNKLSKNVVGSFCQSIQTVLGSEIGQIKKYQYILAKMNLRQYMSWLAFNRFVQNGDYTDELFLSIKTTQKGQLFIQGFSGWDYDDILQAPHNHNFKIFPGGLLPLVYSTEVKLDYFIAFSPSVYSEYLREVLNVLDIVNKDLVAKGIAESVAAVLPLIEQPMEIKKIKEYAELLKQKLEKNRELIKGEIIRQGRYAL